MLSSLILDLIFSFIIFSDLSFILFNSCFDNIFNE